MSFEEDSYLTLAGRSEGLYKEKGSKFLAFACPVNSMEEVKDSLDDLKNRYHDARHHCYAYVLGVGREVYRANDDGEPNHSAGDPIMGQINSRQLTNTLVVVIRYFGGTKLGVSGLINAYKTAAGEALDNGIIERREIASSFRLRYPYEATNEVMRLVSDFDISIKAQSFEATCLLEGEVKVSLMRQLNEKVQLLKDTGHRVDLDTGD